MSTVKVLIPWNLPAYASLNGFHPLVGSVVEYPPAGIEFILNDENLQADDFRTRVTVYEFMKAAYQLGGRLEEEDLDDFLIRLIMARDPMLQLNIAAHADQADVVFHHTAPIHANPLPFVLHFESLTTLFFPFFAQGKTSDVNVRQHPIFPIVKKRLESDKCRAIFSHIRSSTEALAQCFDSDIIDEKTHYIRLGVGSSGENSRRVEEKLATPPRTDGINILFTNSYHQSLPSFFLRGGRELIIAFSRIISIFPNSRLTIVSQKPPGADDMIRVLSKNIEWIEDKVSDEKLYDLLLWSDVFAMPAVGLHSYSALRAFKFGSVLLCSDAPGYNEYVDHWKTGVVIPGRFQQCYRYDAETGFMHDNYDTVTEINHTVVTHLTDALYRLAKNPELRRAVANAAYRHATEDHAVEPWAESVGKLLKLGKRAR